MAVVTLKSKELSKTTTAELRYEERPDGGRPFCVVETTHALRGGFHANIITEVVNHFHVLDRALAFYNATEKPTPMINPERDGE